MNWSRPQLLSAALVSVLTVTACTTRRGGRSDPDETDGSDGTSADAVSTNDIANPVGDAPSTDTTIPDPVEGCSKDHPEGLCEGGGLCQDGACVTPTVAVTSLAVTEDHWFGEAAPAYGGSTNGLVDAGEEVALRPTLTNTGTLNYLSVSGTLSSADARVTVVANEAVYDDLVTGGSKDPAPAFRIRVAPDVPSGSVITLSLAVVDSKEGAVVTLPISVGVRSGLGLGMANPFVDDDTVGKSTGDGDHKVDAGEAIELFLDLQNRGPVGVPVVPLPFDQVGTPLDDQQVEVRMTSASGLITVLNLDNPPSFAASLAAGATQSSAADFDFTVAEGAEEGDSVCLDFTIALKAGDQELYSFSEVRCIAIGGPVGEACSPISELCNALDDDCDGTVDNQCVSTCGDGVPDPWEACDDKNTKSGDGCSGDCKVSEGCGNGVVDPGEACDTDIAGSCPAKPACEAQTNCTTKYVHSGIACLQKCTASPGAGTTCDDKNACTTGDKCQEGKCVGTPKTCGAAPKNSCVGLKATIYSGGTGTCEAGNCVFPKTEQTCKKKCAGEGFCSPEVIGGSVVPVAGTFRFFAAVATPSGVIQLVYSGQDAVRMAEVTSVGPTGNDAPISYVTGAGIFGLGAGIGDGGKLEAAYATNTGLLYVGTSGTDGYSDSWQSSTAPPDHRDLTAAWTSDGKAQIFLREPNTKALYHRTEGDQGSVVTVASSVLDLGRAFSFGKVAWAPIQTTTNIQLYAVGGDQDGPEVLPGSDGGGEPALGIAPNGTRYVAYRKAGKLVLATDLTGSWESEDVLNLDPDDTGFSIAISGDGLICISIANHVLKEMSFFLIGPNGTAGYLIDNEFENAIQQQRFTDVIADADGRFYLSYLTADTDVLVSVVITPDL